MVAGSSLRVNRPGTSLVLTAAASGFETELLNRGGDPDAVLRNAGISAKELLEPTNIIPVTTFCRMLELASTSTRDPNFGLHYGHRFEPEMYGLLGFVALASPSARSALSNFMEFFPYHQSGTETKLTINGDLLRMEYRIVDASIINRRQNAEATISGFANMARRCLGSDYRPVRVDFEHPEPASIDEHHGLFDADVAFSQRTNALIMRVPKLDATLPNFNVQLFDVLRSSLKKVGCPGVKFDLVTLAAAEIRSKLPSRKFKLDHVADAIGTPTWILQRRLAEDGLTFNGLVEKVRRDLAEDYMGHRHIALSEIAYLLGYSELSAFSRAFRGWHGISPQKYRVNVGSCRPSTHN